jgi:hypothetical protein
MMQGGGWEIPMPKPYFEQILRFLGGGDYEHLDKKGGGTALPEASSWRLLFKTRNFLCNLMDMTAEALFLHLYVFLCSISLFVWTLVVIIVFLLQTFIFNLQDLS